MYETTWSQKWPFLKIRKYRLQTGNWKMRGLIWDEMKYEKHDHKNDYLKDENIDCFGETKKCKDTLGDKWNLRKQNDHKNDHL